MRHKSHILFAIEIAVATIFLSLYSEPSLAASGDNESYAAAALIYTVNSTEDTDDGTCDATHCTLREALNAANANADQDIITFNIPGTGPHTISPLTPLPTITDPVIIEGTTQPGANCDSWPPNLHIELAGPGTGTDNGLTLSADDSLIRGLVINRFGGDGILVTGDHNRFECNFIGTDVTGRGAAGNSRGLNVTWSSNYTRIGTNGDGLDDATERNLISGNTVTGIRDSGSYTVIAGNYIGTDVSGTAAMGNGKIGIFTDVATNSRIGTDSDGIADELERNIISANGAGDIWSAGIWIQGDQGIFAGNYIGTDVSGLAPLGNAGSGIVLFTVPTDNLVGGTSSAAGNLIAYNQLDGVYIAWACDDGCGIGVPHQMPVIHNAVRGNSIHSNQGLGINIDLKEMPWEPDGPLPNDPGDIDEGLNDLQNYLVLTTITSHTVTGTLDSQPNSTYVIELFSQAQCDPSGYGEGEVFRGTINVTTDASGYASFTYVFSEVLPIGHVLTSTTTNAAGSTSEFSLCATITEQSAYIVTNTNATGAGSLRQAIIDANAHAGFDVINFNIPGPEPHTIWPGSNVPIITDPVLIDGCSQPSADCSQWPPTLKIELHGTTDALPVHGLIIDAGNSIVRGLVINGASTAITLNTGSGNHIYSNFIGTDVTGTVDLGNKVAGILCRSNHNIIGTNGDGVNDAAERNLISGTDNPTGGSFGGVALFSSSNIVAGNFIGTDITGTQPLGNYTGILIVGNENRIGTNADGISDEQERNIISANDLAGIGLNGSPINDNPIIKDTIIKGNYIGTDVTGTQPLGNKDLAGILFQGSIERTMVGGTSPVEQNIIAFNTGFGGVIVTGNIPGEPAPFSIQNALRGNRIHSNTGLGIELDSSHDWTLDGPTPNDPQDADTGSNNHQNFPVLTMFTSNTIQGTLNSTPNTTFTLDFYSNATCDPAGYGEGEIYQPVTEPVTVTTDANGDAAFSFTFTNSIPADHVVTATATDPEGNTSEFSLCRAIPGSLSIYDVMVIEGNNGATFAIFAVSLSKASDEIVTVDYTTINGTATAGSDYTAVSGTLTFQPGTTDATINVPILGDKVAEGDETFVINLSNPQNALLANVQGTATITDQMPWLYSPANGALANDATPRFIWRAADGATAYRLQVDNNADFSSPLFSRSITGTTYAPSDALSNGRYYWRVRAKNANGQWGPWTVSWSFKVDTRPPAVPVLLAPANHAILRDNTPTFRWQASTGAVRYRLQVDNNADFSSPVINILTATTSYTRPASLGDRVYYWRLAARDAAGNTSRWSAVWSFTLDAMRPMPEPTATLPATLTPVPSDTPTATSTPTEVLASPTPIPTEVIVNPLQWVESDHSAVQQTGVWTSHITDVASGGSYLYSSGSFDDVLSLSFMGTQLEVIYVKHPALGTFAVEIDGVVMQLVDSVAQESDFGAQILVSGLVDGPHILKIYPVAGVVALDAFGVEALPDVDEVTPTPTTIPTDQPTLDITLTDGPSDLPTPTPTDLPPGEPTLTPTPTLLPVTLPFIETFDSGLNWQPTGVWTFDTQTAYRGAGWFASSTTRGQNSILTYGGQIDLRNALHPELSYWQKTTLAQEDQFAFEVSIDSGLTWQALDLQSGSTMDWTLRTLDLTAYRGQVISLRFRLDTTNPLSEGAMTMGMWVDELVIQEAQPTPTPTSIPTNAPTATDQPTSTRVPTETPSMTPSLSATSTETPSPTDSPTDVPAATPTETPTEIPIDTPELDTTEEPVS